MYNTALRILEDTAEAEDIMQESFLVAFQRLNSFTGEGSFGSWLKRIVVNNSLDVLRKKKEHLSLAEHPVDIPDLTEETDDYEIHMRVAEVKAVMQELPVDFRIILNLYLIEGYDHEEIAEMLGISNQLSRTRFCRARQRLVEELRIREKKRSFVYN